MSPLFIKNYSNLIPPHLSESQSLLRKTILNALELAIKSVMPKNMMLRTKDTKATCTGRLDDTVILYSGIPA